MVEQHISKHENTETLEEVQHSWAEPWSIASQERIPSVKIMSERKAIEYQETGQIY